jgi:aldose 1-epimerase
VLEGDAGVRVALTSWGATLVSVEAPDRAGVPGHVLLGFEAFAAYEGPHPHFGCLVGRCANRIRDSRFELDGAPVVLTANLGRHHLHGGALGFGRALWEAEVAREPGGPVLRLRHESPDGDEGYPGRLRAEVEVRLRGGELGVRTRAETDAPTLVNLVHHPYFDLGDAGDVLGHVLRLDAARFTPVDADLVPTGEVRPVAGSAFDFRAGKPIGRDLRADDEQLRLAGGYDHNFALDGTPGTLRPAARVEEPRSGRVLEILTTQPGVQLYTGNSLDGSLVGRGGRRYGRHAGLCLETQRFPDAPHHPHFPSAVLRPGERYQEETRFRFGTCKEVDSESRPPRSEP